MFVLCHQEYISQCHLSLLKTTWREIEVNGSYGETALSVTTALLTSVSSSSTAPNVVHETEIQNAQQTAQASQPELSHQQQGIEYICIPFFPQINKKHQRCVCMYVCIHTEFVQAGQFVAQHSKRKLSDDDLVYLTNIDDIFIQVRIRTCCVMCEEPQRTMAMSLCCLQMNCLECYRQFWESNYSVLRCPNCNTNWGAFQLPDILVAPPCEENPNDDAQLKQIFQDQYKELVLKVYKTSHIE